MKGILDAMDGATSLMSEKQQEVVVKWQRDFLKCFGGGANSVLDDLDAGLPVHTWMQQMNLSHPSPDE